jgi:hypothetical protein
MKIENANLDSVMNGQYIVTINAHRIHAVPMRSSTDAITSKLISHWSTDCVRVIAANEQARHLFVS